MSGTSAGQRTFEIRITGDATSAQNAMRGAASAADRAKQSIDSVGSAGRAAEAALGNFSGRLGGVGSGLAAMGAAGQAAAIGLGAMTAALAGVAAAGDSMTQSMARLRIATGGVAAARDVYEQLYRLSLVTGVSVQESVGVFQRFAIAARNIGATNEQVVALVKTLQQAGIVAGISSQEAANAMMQLSQALASGSLNGEELRSVLENMSPLAEKLARELGVGIGELRQMGAEGKLTADRVFPALLRAGQEIQREFEQMPMTLSRGFGILQEATTRFLGDLDKAIGLSGALANALAAVGRGFESARAGLFPTPEAAARAGLAGAMARVAELDRQLSLYEPGARSQPNRNAIRPGLQGTAAAQAGAERQAELRAEREAALAEARRHAEELERIEAESRDRRAQEAQAAAARAAQATRERDTKEQRALEEALDARRKAQRQYTEDMEALRGRLERGSIDQATFDRTAAELRERLAAADREAARAAREAAREDEQAAAKRNRVVEAMQAAEAAARRELEATRLGTAAREEANTENEIAQRLHEAGIPLTERRTAAEAEAAAAIERSVRAARAYRAELDRLDDAARESARAAQRAAQEVVNTAKSISDDAAEAVFDSLTGERRAQGVLDWFRTLFKRIAVQALSANIFLPISTAIVGAVPGLFGISAQSGATAGILGGAGGLGGLGGLGNLVSLGGGLNSLTGGGLMSSLGLGNIGSTIGGFMSAPLWGGTSGLSAAALSGPGGLAALEASGGAAGGFIAPSLSQLLGPAALGALGGGLIAQLTGGNRIGGSIGGGLGAGAGFLLGGPVGALIGGALGGGLGGLFGNNGKGFSGGDALVGRDNAGGLVVTGFAGKRFDPTALMQQAQNEVAAFNARMQAAGVFMKEGMRANIGGGQSRAPRTLAGALDAYGFGLGSNDPRIAAAIAPYAGNIEAALAIAEEAKAVIAALENIKPASNQFAASLKALDDQFRPLWESTVKLGFGFEEVNVAWTKAQQDLVAQRDRTVAGLAESIRIRDLRAQGRDAEAALAEFDFRAVDEVRQLQDQLTALGVEAEAAAAMLDNLRATQARERAELLASGQAAGSTLARLGEDIDAWLRRMTTTPAGGLSAQEQLINARGLFDQTLAGARLNDADALRNITGAAEAYLNAYRAVNGSAGFGNVRDFVLDQIASLDAVTQARLPAPAAGTVTMTSDPALLAENAALRQQVAAMRQALEANTQAQERLYYALPPVVVGARG
jgi:tape measure domain-containing protein